MILKKYYVLISPILSTTYTMKDSDKTKPQLIEELRSLRSQSIESKYLGRVINASLEGVLVCNPNLPDNPIIFTNATFTNMTGYSKQESFNKNCRMLQGPNTAPETISKIRYAIENKLAFQGEILNYKKDGTAFWLFLIIEPIFDDDGNIIYFLGLQRDITKSKQVEEKLNNTLKKLKLAMETAKLGIWRLNIETGTLEWNDEQLNIYGITRQGFEANVDEWKFRLYPDDSEYTNSRLKKIFEGKNISNVEFRVIRPNGEIRYINTSGGPSYNEEGKMTELIGINIDITKNKRLEGQLRQTSKMEALGTLAGGIAHDFNNILASIIGNSELMLMKILIDNKEKSRVEGIHKSAQRGVELVRQIMAFSRIDHTNFKSVSLAKIVNDALDMLKATTPNNIHIFFMI
jgi:PAS domain S-box-containing protein